MSIVTISASTRKDSGEHRNHFLSAQVDWDVDFGDGTITDVFGFYDADGSALIDVDSSPENLLNIRGWTPYRQWSNELRYAGRVLSKVSTRRPVFITLQAK